MMSCRVALDLVSILWNFLALSLVCPRFRSERFAVRFRLLEGAFIWNIYRLPPIASHKKVQRE